MRFPSSLVPIILCLAGCSTEVQRLQSPSARLTPDSSFYVSVCADGLHDGHRQVASGLMTSQLLSADLKARARRVESGEREESVQSALIFARHHDLRYVAYPSILDWQNDATPMASVTDKVKVRIDIIDVASADVIDTVILQKQMSAMATSKTAPQELLAAPMNEYIETLIQLKKDESKRSFWSRVESLFGSENSDPNATN